MVREIIDILLRFRKEGMGVMNQFITRQGKLVQVMRDAQGHFAKATPMQKFGQRLDGLVSTTNKYNNKTGLMTKSLTGFRMEMLSVMFFGMQLQQMMFGLLRPAFEVSGIFDIISSTLEVLFLPIALALLPVILKIADFFMNLPEPVKLFLGVLVLVIGVVGMLLFFGGQLVLFLGGLAITFGGLAIGFPILLKIGAAILGISTAITGAIIGAEKFKEIGGMEGVKDKIIGFLEGIKGKLPEGFQNILDKIIEFIKNWKGMETLKELIGNGVGWIKGKILEGFKSVFKQLKEIPVIGDIIEFFEKIWNGILGFIQEVKQIRSIGEAVRFVFGSLGEFLSKMGEFIGGRLIKGIFDMIASRGLDIAKGLINAITGRFETLAYTPPELPSVTISNVVNTGPLYTPLDADSLARQISSNTLSDLRSAGMGG